LGPYGASLICSTFNTFRQLHYGCSLVKGSSFVPLTVKKVWETSGKKKHLKM